MAEKATYIYDKYPTIFNDHIQSEFISNNPFTFPGLEIISKGKDSKRLHATPGPKVIIAGSGMMTGGRVLGHAAHYLPIASTRLFIVGYQGEETLGRALMEGEKLVTIDRVPVPVNCTVGNTQAMSSHADQKQLLQWLKHIKNVKKVFLTHGEDGPRTSLSQKISENLGLTDVTMPVMNQEIRL